MQLDRVLDTLEYTGSPSFLVESQFGTDPDFGHIFRQAQRTCRLHGVYALRGSSYDRVQSNTPVVYVCQADTDADAREIHRHVWNQNIVPFLLVISPGWVRLYSGFRYERREDERDDPRAGILRTLRDYNEVRTTFSSLSAESIDSGTLWKDWGESVTPETRVDWKLLSNLQKLDEWLREQGVEDRLLSHSIIGKFVYLHYLHQRRILSDRKLEEWGVDPHSVFSGNARLSAFLEVIDRLEDWLNGSVFPMSHSKIKELGAERLRKVAAIFMGETMGGQLPLGFDAYDFSFIPIETLSVIYEQFLHAAPVGFGKSAGESRGAYYTPVPLVNFMLDRLDSRRTLKAGMRVLDPACGSGAFLVQCYRKLIEAQIRSNAGERPRPTELRRLLVDHIFGVDTDEDACQIAELSLILTLLEYVEPPDLTNTNFRLPQLRDRNIFCGNAFDDSDRAKSFFAERFDWVIGNPPWLELNPGHLDEVERPVFDWIQRNKGARPIGGNQVAEAFAWRSLDLLGAGGCAALVVPAMTLFKYESEHFRKRFFESTRVWSVANFANFAEVLFGGRSRLPAAALFYSPHEPAEVTSSSVEVYSPLVANQPVNDSGRIRRRRQTWSIVVNTSEIREIPYREIVSGAALPWKIAMWGSDLDRRLLAKVSRGFRTLADLEAAGQIVLSEGPQLRTTAEGARGQTEHHPELAGLKTVDVRQLKNARYLLRFPKSSVVRIPPDGTHVSKRAGFRRPMSVARPPHVLVSASRTFAVYSEEFLVVPARQIGIVSTSDNRPFLKAIALYLNSDFVTYHQFLAASEAGIQKARSTLRALRALPVPFDATGRFTEWEASYARLGTETPGADSFDREDLIRELNQRIFDALRLDGVERAAVSDLVNVRLSLIQGKMGAAAVSPPSRADMDEYARALRDELDAFIGQEVPSRHLVRVVFDQLSGCISVSVVDGTVGKQAVAIVHADFDTAQELAEIRAGLREKRAQWVYFNRNLRIYKGSAIYVLKPLQRLHWTVTQAVQDAGEIIAETVRPSAENMERIAG